MECKLCKSNRVKISYQGLIRNGGLGKYTNDPVTMWQCEDCGVIWHEKVIEDTKQYYQSREYRNSLEGSSEEEVFYALHDRETFDKFQYTGTDIYRHKTVADIGCGAGAFLDFLKGVAKDIVAIEPSEAYRKSMDKKGFATYAYAKDAKTDWKNKVDVITSFDVIEHVDDPRKFMEDAFELLAEGEGRAVIGTPTDMPIMRGLLGEIFEKKLLFSTQHIWVFSEKNLRMLAEEAGFKKIEIKYFQRYGIGNFLGWLREKEPKSDINETYITDTLNSVWKSECNARALSDYIVLYAYK